MVVDLINPAFWSLQWAWEWLQNQRMLRPLQLPDNFSGKLWLTAMPGRFKSLEKFLGWCRGVSVDQIVCTVHEEEIAEKSPEYAAELEAGTFSLPVEQFSIPDYGVPKDIKGLAD